MATLNTCGVEAFYRMADDLHGRRLVVGLCLHWMLITSACHSPFEPKSLLLCKNGIPPYSAAQLLRLAFSKLIALPQQRRPCQV